MTAEPQPHATGPDTAHQALRAHDIHQGLHVVDRNIGLVGSQLDKTQLVGMAAALATAIKGRELIASVPDLKTVAAEQLDIDRWAFNGVVDLLEAVDFIRAVQRTAGDPISFYESVPESFESLYATLGEVWNDRHPGEIEKSLVWTVDELSFGPRRVIELDIDPAARDRVLALGQEAEAIQVIDVGGEQVAHSPFFAYEHPESMAEVLANLEIDSVRDAFVELRHYQGMPIDKSKNPPILRGLVAAGLVAAPLLEDPSGHEQGFAIAAYGLGRPDLLTIRKPVLDKALAILSAIRLGEHFGGITSLKWPLAILRRLQDPTWSGAYHSSTTRQYKALFRLGIIRFVGTGALRGIQLIDSADNREAVGLAIELISFGEATTSKETTIDPAQGLAAQGIYRFPIQGIPSARRRNPLPDKLMDSIYEAAMGRGLL